MNRIFSASSQITNKMSPIQKVTHCIFDMDGLLLDTEPIYTQVFQQILSEYNKTFTWDLKVTLMGLHSDAVAKRVVEYYSLPIEWEEFAVRSRALTVELMADAEFLPDTEHIYEDIVRTIANRYNKPYPWNVRMKILGTTEQATATIAVNDLQLPITVPEFTEQFEKLMKQRLANTPFLRGAVRLLQHLNETNIPFCLATSSSKEMADIKMSRHQDIFSLFHHKVMGSTDPDVKNGKPAPDIFIVAASRFPDKPKPENCLVFEDAPNGVRAAYLAGMPAVMVPDKNVADELRKEATIVLKSLEDFEPELFGLPQFKTQKENLYPLNRQNGHH